MPGVAQVWLTQEELDALLHAAPNKRKRVSDRLWANLEPKLTTARDALGCPVPPRPFIHPAAISTEERQSWDKDDEYGW